LIHTLVTTRQERAGGMVETKGISQPFTLKGGADQDFGEWIHNVRTFMLARFGDQTLTALPWATRQQRIVVKTCVASQRNRLVPWITVFGEDGDWEERIDEIDDFVGKLYAYLCVLYNRRSQQDCPKLWRRKWLGSLETTAQRVRPDIVMRRVAILQQVQNPSRCQRVEDLGTALEDWLSEKRQYEMFTDRNGRPCQASDDSLVAAMFRLMPKSLEETVMFAHEDEGFQELYDRLLAYGSTKQSISMSENKTTRKDDPMDVDAPNVGSGKGKSKEKGKKSKGKDKLSNAENSNWQKGGTEKGDEHADEWTWKGDEQADEWRKATDWQTGTGSAWWTTANDCTLWETEEPVGGFEINNTERCSSKNPGKGRWRRTRKKRPTVISPTPTEQRVVVPPGLLHVTRISIEDLVNSDRCRRRTPTPAATPRLKSTRSPSESSATSEISGMSGTNASDTSETSSTSSVETLTPESLAIDVLARCLPADLSSYNSDGRHVVHVVPCAPRVPHV